MNMKKTIKTLITIFSLITTGAMAGAMVLFADNFDAPNNADLNHEIESRTSGGQLQLKWNTHFDRDQNSHYSIVDKQLVYRGPGGADHHPDKLFLSNPENNARINFAKHLAGKKYQISFSVATLGTDNIDALGFTISDHPSGGGNGVLSVRQLRLRSMVAVIENGDLTRIDQGFPMGRKNDFRIVVDESGDSPSYQIYRNDRQVQGGEFTVDSEDRYIYLQIADRNRNARGLVDDFSIVLLAD
jgi:hypothetical protein